MAAGVLLTMLSIDLLALEVETAEDWRRSGEAFLKHAQRLEPSRRRARNVILFVGDGMGVATVTAARILEGQRRRLAPYHGGEENFLSFERFPYLALSRTYSANQQVADSAPTMTAMVTGVKTNDGVLSLGPEVERCAASGKPLPTLLELALARKLATGIVTTARVTHATPAALYAHTSNREWEGDDKTPKDSAMPSIADQLMEYRPEQGLQVLLGGGRRYFYCTLESDPEYKTAFGEQEDCKSVREWREHAERTYVWNRGDFLAAPEDRPLLGLFEPSHMKHEVDRKTGDEPSLAEMTRKAIAILRRNPKGFFLMVEAGRIDHAHHAGNAFRALTDTIALSDAVRAADELTGDEDTLIVVTADHSHVFTIAGYPERGNPILGLARSEREGAFVDLLGLPYTTLGYANGPGYGGEMFRDEDYEGGDGCGPSPLPLASATSSYAAPGPKTFNRDGKGPHRAVAHPRGRTDLSKAEFENLVESAVYVQEAGIPLSSETHGGEDVAIYAKGPAAHWVHGVMEQHALFYVMAEALGLQREIRR